MARNASHAHLEIRRKWWPATASVDKTRVSLSKGLLSGGVGVHAGLFFQVGVCLSGVRFLDSVVPKCVFASYTSGLGLADLVPDPIGLKL